MRTIRIIIAEDHAIVRQGLRALITADPDLQVAGEAADGKAAVELARELKPDVVVMDIAMPMMNGLEATRQIRKDSPSSKVLVLSSYGDDEIVQSLLEGGATGYITKHSASIDLLTAIREVSMGRQYLSARIALRMKRREMHSSAHRYRRPGTELTCRETQVLSLIATGLGSKGVASELGISTKTVEKHRQAIMEKLDIHEIASLTRYATAHGLVTTPGVPASQLSQEPVAESSATVQQL